MDVNTHRKGSQDGCLPFYFKYHSLSKLNPQIGLTLLELVFSIAIISVLGVSMSTVSASFIGSNKIANAVNRIAADMAFARSEAVMRGEHVELCKSLDGLTCSRRKQWESGWIIFVDKNHNRKREVMEPLLKYQAEISSINITYRGSGSSHYIRFRADGASGTNGTFAFCSDKAGRYKRALILFRTGRLRLSQTRSGGRAISCADFRTH